MEECFPLTEQKSQAQMHHILPHCQSVVRLHFLLCFVLGIEFMCVLGKYCPVPLSHTLTSEMSLLIGLLSYLDLFPEKPKNWSLFQFISVLKPGCLNLLKSSALPFN